MAVFRRSELDTVTSSQKSSESGNLEKELVTWTANSWKNPTSPLFFAAITVPFHRPPPRDKIPVGSPSPRVRPHFHAERKSYKISMQHSDQTESPSNRSESDLRASKYNSLITNYGRRREEEEREKGERGGEREDESLRLTRVSKTRRRPMDGMGGGVTCRPLAVRSRDRA